MTDRDRLAADLHGEDPTSGGPNADCGCYLTADRLIAIGWTRLGCEGCGDRITGEAWHYGCAERLDENRLARALVEARVTEDLLTPTTYNSIAANKYPVLVAAAIAKAYREDTDAHD